MSVIVPTGDGKTPFFTIQANLDDLTYTLQFRWNVRLGAWFMDILDEQGVVQILTNLRLVANWFLAGNDVGHLPPGAFMCWDSSGQKQDPGFADLGVRHLLFYITQADLGIH